MAVPIMIQGTMSNAGKSLICAALCRIFSRAGLRTAPFKSQNMALNSYITDDGLEMGRAQAVQAEAAGIRPSALMNPILLKPTSDVGSQVIVNGRPRGNMRAADYFKYKKELIPDILAAYNALSAENDIIVIEGAGSPAEINLKSGDIVNMGLAELVDAPVLLVGDIDRGGVFAQLAGTLLLLDDKERARVRGTIINKFRGDVEILKPGIKMLEEITKKKNAGVVPYGDFLIDDEDSLSERLVSRREGAVDIAVVRLPHISNFTDMSAFEFADGAGIRYVSRPSELGKPDMIIIPGTKNTVSDMLWLRRSGMEAAILRRAESAVIFGICGGYQMLGKKITDGVGAESGGSVDGMGLLDIKTEFNTEKTTKRVFGRFNKLDGILSPLSGAEFSGYEIHMGNTLSNETPLCTLGGAQRGSVYGSYVHGIFDSCAQNVVSALAARKGVTLSENTFDISELKNREYDKLADIVEKSLDMDFIYKIIKGH
ncbi:MAG TPA: cobyric acid synthase [Candidatus Ornithomonoglobus intestinigallinarum]|uniref:Cobyric acid synthase n=1 Tax=Candidatus Ornithomonoglobus intestinigallinarum TaxID=2840894 RepID=A0A9D1KRK5_9FIRM|nr:cobyric acid synthase [Candidatus Ornithomonoglobus intestinigallinarum]